MARPASTDRLLDFSQKQIVSILWLGASAWFCQTTQEKKTDIDRVAKVGPTVMYDQAYSGFDEMLHISKIVKPNVQMTKKQINVLLNLLATPRSVNGLHLVVWIMYKPEPRKTNYATIPAHTDRFRESPIPHFNQILIDKRAN